jgi:hypothetical protein
MAALPRPDPIGGVDEYGLVDRLQDTARHLLDDLVFCSGQGKKDTQLSDQSTFFVVVRTDIPEIRMLPPAVIEPLDGSEDIVFGFSTRDVITG